MLRREHASKKPSLRLLSERFTRANVLANAAASRVISDKRAFKNEMKVGLAVTLIQGEDNGRSPLPAIAIA